VRNVGGLIEVPMRPGFEKSEEEAGGDAGEGEPIGEPEVLRVEGGERDQQPAEGRVAEELDKGVREQMRDFAGGEV